MLPTRMGTSVVVGVGVLVVLVVGLLTGCGSSRGRSGDAPAGITTVTWPSEDPGIERVVGAAPGRLDGWTAGPVEANGLGTGFSVDYTSTTGSGTHRPFASGERPRADDDGPLETILGLLMWAGAPQGCIDMTGSPTAVSLVQAMAGDTELDIPTPDPAAVEWIACTSVVNVDGGPGTLPPELHEHLLVWTSNGSVFAVSGRSDAMRDEIASAMVDAARG